MVSRTALTIVVPYPPGGCCGCGCAHLCRAAHPFTEATGRCGEQAPGAGTAIAAELVAKSAPDGYTLSLVPTGQVSVLPHLVKDLRFDPFTSFAPISQLAYTAAVIAAAQNFPVQNLAELVAMAKAKPSALSPILPVAMARSFTLPANTRASASGTSSLHVPFKGSAPAVVALLSGNVNIAFDTLTVLAPQIKSGKLKGITTQRSDPRCCPICSTIAESGFPGFRYLPVRSPSPR